VASQRQAAEGRPTDSQPFAAGETLTLQIVGEIEDAQHNVCQFTTIPGSVHQLRPKRVAISRNRLEEGSNEELDVSHISVRLPKSG
jgi:hypothetical protein